jgi:hypothetical protein
VLTAFNVRYRVGSSAATYLGERPESALPGHSRADRARTEVPPISDLRMRRLSENQEFLGENRALKTKSFFGAKDTCKMIADILALGQAPITINTCAAEWGGG